MASGEQTFYINAEGRLIREQKPLLGKPYQSILIKSSSSIAITFLHLTQKWHHPAKHFQERYFWTWRFTPSIVIPMQIPHSLANSISRVSSCLEHGQSINIMCCNSHMVQVQNLALLSDLDFLKLNFERSCRHVWLKTIRRHIKAGIGESFGSLGRSFVGSGQSCRTMWRCAYLPKGSRFHGHQYCYGII